MSTTFAIIVAALPLGITTAWYIYDNLHPPDTMTLQSSSDLPLFGGKLHWNAHEWTSSDDRVRGGDSISQLEIVGDGSAAALFTGVLDINKLGGAGFASQRTASDEKTWDLTGYDYIKVAVQTDVTDDCKYTFLVKDTLLPPDPKTGREQSTVSYEVDFELEERDRSLDTKMYYFRLDDLVAHYRGRKRDDAAPLKKDGIRRFSIMMRSHFGAQFGPFRLGLLSFSAVKKPPITKSVSFHADAGSYGTFRPWHWQRGRKENQHTQQQQQQQALTRHERFKQWARGNRDYVVLAGFCVSMGVVIVLFGLIDGNKPWTRRPTPT